VKSETKALKLELKSDSADGGFQATFATLNVVDHHGDVTVPGAFVDGKEVLIGAYQHEMFNLPVGKGVIRADEKRAWVDGAFFLDTQPGKDTYATVKNAGGLMEWSYIFTVQDSSEGEFDPGNGSAAMQVRYLKKLDVWSVDPVLKGAGIGTRTDSIKSLDRGLGFMAYSEGLSEVVDAYIVRVKERLAVRMKEGRQLSAANVERLGSIAGSLKAAAGDLEQLLTDANPPKSADVVDQWALFQRNLAQLNGLPIPA
jgi:hypothetical protein